MSTYTWSFAQSFLCFLLIVFLAQSVATKLRNILPMPLIFGALITVGFALKLLPEDLLQASNMVAVGTIAFNVLVIHSGTMVNLRLLRVRWRETLLCFLSTLVTTGVLLLILPPIIGQELALLAPGSVMGGGASCAIGSRWVSNIRPDISFFPWMVFMFQGVFSVPVVTWALAKQRDLLMASPNGLLNQTSLSGTEPVFGMVGIIPKQYKTPAYYLGLIMIVAVLNYALQSSVLKNTGINLNITALLLGIVAGNSGFIDRAPLLKCDSYGLLILSLMGLMANNLANTPLKTIFTMILPVLLALLLGSIVLIACGLLFAKWLKLSPYLGIILTMNSVMGFPVNRALAEQTVAKMAEPQKSLLSQQLSLPLGMSTILISNGISVFLISTLVSFVR